MPRSWPSSARPNDLLDSRRNDSSADDGAGGAGERRLLEPVAVMDRLRSPGGCPWDAEQTHHCLVPYLLEEAYEAYRGAGGRDPDALRDELGDVLLQVLFHARIAAEEPEAPGTSTTSPPGSSTNWCGVTPMFSPRSSVSGTADVEANWDAIKKAEKPGRTSPTASRWRCLRWPWPPSCESRGTPCR